MRTVVAWVLFVWTALFGVWIGSYLVQRAQEDCGAFQGACNTVALGGVTWLPLIWFLVAVPLAIIWYALKPKQRQCPACGRAVPEGYTICSCGWSFVSGGMVPQAGQTRLVCQRCRARITYGVPTCPGCGGAIDWGVTPQQLA